MSDGILGRQQQIDEIEAALKTPGLPDIARQVLEKQLLDLQADNEISSTKMQGSRNLNDEARINGVAVGLNLGKIIFGRDPEEDERRRLVWYLDRLSAKLYHLQLRGLDEQLARGKGLGLPQVYVMLATLSNHSVVGKLKSIRSYFEEEDLENGLKSEYLSEYALPFEDFHSLEITESSGRFWETTLRPGDQHFQNVEEYRDLIHSPKRIAKIALVRHLLATEAVQKYQHLVLLGDPGSGKSTFVRHLAWVLAQRGLDQLNDATTLYGWNQTHLMLPIILPLRTLAGHFAHKKSSETDTIVYSALRDEMQRYQVGNGDDLLSEALYRGKVLLLFDGLDEVPLQAVPDVADRYTTLQAVQNFMQLHNKVPALITCRIRAFDNDLRNALDWQVETIAPFTLGQIRHFVPAWYGELVSAGQINQEQAKGLENQLLETILANQKLQDMARTPLLLTMMAIVLYNKNELPRDRPQLYERILELLLGQWDKVHEGQSLSEAIGQPDWGSERIQPVLDFLSYQAHLSVASSDGRGRLTRSAVHDALITFFETARLSNAWEAAQRCLHYFEQRSGLLIADENDSYVFAHLTLQEHCAGRYIMLQRGAATLVMKHRADDRWREPIFLGLGVIQQTKSELIDRILDDLIDTHEARKNKPDILWQRDLLLAAEIGADRDWNYLRTQEVRVDRQQRNVKQGLVQLLQDRRQLLSATERIRAGLLLGDLGDPRFPITVEEWRREVARALDGDTSGYFCQVEPGTYIIGSTSPIDVEEEQYTIKLDASFLIARYTITNAQWLVWQKNDETSASSEDHLINHPNQPIVYVKFGICQDFCTWLSNQIGYTVRLPNEYEWEAAARGGDARNYPWGDEWQDDCVPTNELLANMDITNQPVGCYPAGSSPCGAMDMVGNVWQYTTWKTSTKIDARDERMPEVVCRGRYLHMDKRELYCSTRFRLGDDSVGNAFGFRIVIPVS